jgi:hypothetical protein
VLLQRLDEEEDFGGHGVVHIRVVGERAVAAAGDDSLENLDEGAQPSGLRSGSELIKVRRRGRGMAGNQRFRYGKADAAIGILILAAVAPVGEVALNRLALRLRGGDGISSVCLDFPEDCPRCPRRSRMAELRQ